MSNAETLAPFVAMALEGIVRPYPYHQSTVLCSDDDQRLPRELTPVFAGCYDWHSAVHGHWLLARALRLFPNAEFADSVRQQLHSSLEPEALGLELAHMVSRPSFERPYGLAWLLQLHAELHYVESELAARVEPLASQAAQHLSAWLPKLSGPTRSGTHAQTAFSLGLALDWARDVGRDDARARWAAHARRLHGADRRLPIHLEPGGEDFLSGSLAAADLMRRVLSVGDYDDWLDAALPQELPLTPVRVSDASDGRLAHLDGLNLSRAFMLDGILDLVPNSEPRRDWRLVRDAHAVAGLHAVAQPGLHYAGSHWLGTFAAYLLTRRGVIPG